MQLFFGRSIPSVVLMSLVLLASAQRTSNNANRDSLDLIEVARQNQITQQILEAFIQKKLGITRNRIKPPSVHEILPVKILHEVRNVRSERNGHEDEELISEEQDEGDENLQSVESELVNSIYSEGTSKGKQSLTSTYDADIVTNTIGYRSKNAKRVDDVPTPVVQQELGECPSSCGTTILDDEIGVTRWTMPLLKSGEKRYYLGIFFKANWFKAQQYCRFHGMHLASISSQEENDRLEKYVKDSGFGREHFWTSGTDLAEEGNFFWLANGKPLTFVNWNAGEPNNFRYENGEEENCLELWNRDDKGLRWNDSPCSFETYFICEVRTD